MVIEDLHYLDSGQREYLDRLIKATQNDSEKDDLPTFDRLGRRRGKRFKGKPWYKAPDGVKCYDKYKDTMEAYGFPKGSDSFAASGSKKRDTEKMRMAKTYRKPYFFRSTKTNY